MKVTAGIHPDLPFPFSNGPEESPEPVRGLPEQPPQATERHQEGIRVLAALLNSWLGRSGLSHDQLVAIAAWGLNENGLIDAAVISRVRNGKQTRGAGWKHLDALAAANHAIWLWQTKGQLGAWGELGPQEGWGVRAEWLDHACWLPHPDDETRPLEFRDFAEVLAGYLDLPDLATPALSPADARRLSDGLARLLESTIAERHWGPREGVRRLLEAYPVDDQARQRRLRAVILGDLQLSREELEAELYSLAEMLRLVRGLAPGSYGLKELRLELSSGSCSDPTRK